MDNDLFDGIDDLSPSRPSNQMPPRRRQASPAARRSAQRRKPSPDRYRSQGIPIQPPQQANTGFRKPKRNTMSAEAQMIKREKERPKANANIFRRAWFFLRTNSLPEMGAVFLSWISRHVYMIFLVAVLFIVVGMMLSRYISAAGALLLVLLGALLSKNDYDTAGYCCYGAAAMDFILPYII